ncbi:hypothetical protein GH714_042056 [Hevea brasiliensis]|uniref:Leucine-rich repeat-containing N-terminal plant-type domain-containing protein n=1 Tax=Hevea brasiliensis TaxID=3981 RepID=A0A6A6MVZ1_HEVBR|nr:hypothetical protein GH714_042056 [Hevea brasiliensis]
MGVTWMEEEELLGLFEVFGALLDDPDWARVHPQPCTDTPWPGVQSLASNPTLSGQIPSSLGHVTSLRVLSLSQNNLQRSIPRELGGLVNLEQLDLSYNNLSGEIPKEIGGLKSLTILDLSWNSLEGQVPCSLGQLNLLHKIDLGSNKLLGRILQIWGS